MSRIEGISEELGGVAEERGRLERETAGIGERAAQELVAVDDAISRVTAERERVTVAIGEERTRLDQIALAAERAKAEFALVRRRVERIGRQIAAQEQLLATLDADLAGAELARRGAVAELGEVRRRAHTQIDAMTAQREQARAEIARLSREGSDLEGALRSLIEPSDPAMPIADLVMRRELLDAELTRLREAEMEYGEGALRDRIRAASDEKRAQLEAAKAALAAQEAALRVVVDERGRVQAGRALANEARRRVDAAHHRFGALERAVEDAQARGTRAIAEAEATLDRSSRLAGGLEVALGAERMHLGDLRRELLDAERAAADIAVRREEMLREFAEERELRQLMEELATIELAVSAALAEREGLERLLLRVQKLVAIS